jgi:hypothetical protein
MARTHERRMRQHPMHQQSAHGHTTEDGAIRTAIVIS